MPEFLLGVTLALVMTFLFGGKGVPAEYFERGERVCKDNIGLLSVKNRYGGILSIECKNGASFTYDVVKLKAEE